MSHWPFLPGPDSLHSHPRSQKDGEDELDIFLDMTPVQAAALQIGLLILLMLGLKLYVGNRRAKFKVPSGDVTHSEFGLATRVQLNAVEEAPVDTLVNSLAAGCPFSNPEKQALLEARTLHERCQALITLLMMERPGQGGGYVQ